MNFNKCCDNPNIKAYEIKHTPKPRKWGESVLESIQMLLWYIPNIDSFQSFKNNLISNKVYENITFSFFLDQLGLSVDDVLFIDKGGEIDDEMWSYYRKDICTNCQKIILVRTDMTKTEDVLRCIRNSVAHGEFTVIDDTFIGFNKHQGKNKAIIKIKPRNLLNSLQKISTTSEYNVVNILANILGKKGFDIHTEYPIEIENRVYRFDMLATKGNRSFIFEFKNLPQNQYIHPDDLKRILNQLKIYGQMSEMENLTLVLVIDKGKLTKASRAIVEQMKNLVVLDINAIKLLPYADSPI